MHPPSPQKYIHSLIHRISEYYEQIQMCGSTVFAIYRQNSSSCHILFGYKAKAEIYWACKQALREKRPLTQPCIQYYAANAEYYRTKIVFTLTLISTCNHLLKVGIRNWILFITYYTWVCIVSSAHTEKQETATCENNHWDIQSSSKSQQAT